MMRSALLFFLNHTLHAVSPVFDRFHASRVRADIAILFITPYRKGTTITVWTFGVPANENRRSSGDLVHFIQVQFLLVLFFHGLVPPLYTGCVTAFVCLYAFHTGNGSSLSFSNTEVLQLLFRLHLIRKLSCGQQQPGAENHDTVAFMAGHVMFWIFIP